MPRQYRAFISVPVSADDDEQALKLAEDYAHSVQEGGGVIGHLELVGEAGADFEIVRVVHADPGFRRQIPPDWKA